MQEQTLYHQQVLVLRCGTAARGTRIHTFSYPATARQSEKTDDVLARMASRKRRERRHPIENGQPYSFARRPDSAFFNEYRETSASSEVLTRYLPDKDYRGRDCIWDSLQCCARSRTSGIFPAAPLNEHQNTGCEHADECDDQHHRIDINLSAPP